MSSEGARPLGRSSVDPLDARCVVAVSTLDRRSEKSERLQLRFRAFQTSSFYRQSSIEIEIAREIAKVNYFSVFEVDLDVARDIGVLLEHSIPFEGLLRSRSVLLQEQRRLRCIRYEDCG